MLIKTLIFKVTFPAAPSPPSPPAPPAVVPIPTAPVCTTTCTRVNSAQGNSNGSSSISFNIRNNNPFPIRIVEVGCATLSNSASFTSSLFYKTTPVAQSALIKLTSLHGWTLGAPLQTVPSSLANVIRPFITGASIVVPPGAYYGFVLTSSATLRYGNGVSAVPTSNTTSNVDLVVSGL